MGLSKRLALVAIYSRLQTGVWEVLESVFYIIKMQDEATNDGLYRLKLHSP